MGVIYRNGIPYGGGGTSIQVNVLPAAKVDLLGTIYQYIGVTDANYTNGYFYECVEVMPATDPKTYTWTQKSVQSGGTGGNANFDIGTVPLGGAGVYEVNAILNNGDNESARAVYSRGVNGELPDWFSLNVKSGLGTDTFHVSTKEYADTKQDKLASGTNIKTVNGNSLLGAGNLDIQSGLNFEIDKEKWYGTYTDETGTTYQVYTKTIYIPALPSTAGITAYPHNISGIKQILSVYGFTTDGFVLNAPRQTTQDNIAIYQVSRSATNQTISIEVGKDRSSKSAYVTLVYAKNN